MPRAETDEDFFEPDAGPGLDAVRYMRAYEFIFENPNWFVNLLLLAVCSFIPIIGNIVISGYQFEILEAMHRRGRDEYPDFDFNDFMEYLNRGLWPFLVAFVASLVVSAIAMASAGGVAFAVVSSAGGWPGLGMKEHILIAAIVMVLFIVSFVGAYLFLVPMLLRAGLMREFSAAFDFRFARDFVSLMWPELLIASVFFFFTGIALMVLGMLACGVGIYISASVLMMAQAHMQYQFYEVYLTRGGELIPIGRAQDLF